MAKTRRRRFVALDRTKDVNGYEVIDAICEGGIAWTCFWQGNKLEFSEWVELPPLPEITDD